MGNRLFKPYSLDNIEIDEMKLTQRQKIEQRLHDLWAKDLYLSSDLDVADHFSLAAQENRFAAQEFGELTNKSLLDLGSGAGETAVGWALRGAYVTAVDISPKLTTIGRKLARKSGVSRRCRFFVQPAEKLNFKDSSFDFVFGSSVLHHVDINQAAKEVHRVLKPDGKAIFIDPLIWNPAIAVYRLLAKEVRTPTEKPLKFSDFKPFSQIFTHVWHREFELSTLLVFVWFYLKGVDPNRERYWKRILTIKGRGKKALKILISLDKWLLKFFPVLSYLCWNTVLVVEK